MNVIKRIKIDYEVGNIIVINRNMLIWIIYFRIWFRIRYYTFYDFNMNSRSLTVLHKQRIRLEYLIQGYVLWMMNYQDDFK